MINSSWGTAAKINYAASTFCYCFRNCTNAACQAYKNRKPPHTFAQYQTHEIHTYFMRPNCTLLPTFLLLFAVASCVKPKIYRAELTARQTAESREAVLNRELTDRKVETASLTKQVGELNRTVGNQEEKIRLLNEELAARTRQMGESASKLASEKTTLERDLTKINAQLELKEEALQRIQKVQQDRTKRMTDIENALIKAYTPKMSTGISIAVSGETLLLTLPDAVLFEPTGLNISASGKTLLTPLAEILLARPELDVDITAYTDNVLPKDKLVKDTWDWSLLRATNIVRLLTQEYNVNANQLTPVGRGEFYPLASNETPEGRQKNRRTVVVVRPVLPVIPNAE